jgi:cytochrome c oxidase subunit 4
MGSANAYIKGKLADVHETHHHVMPIKTYLGVFGALMVLTVLTVLVSYADLGPLALPVAMVVALIKAGFVVGYFMHLKYDTRFHSFVFFSTLIFVAIFFVITFFDLNTRDSVNQFWETNAYARDAGLVEKPAPEIVPIPEEKLKELRAAAAAKAAAGGGEEGGH